MNIIVLHPHDNVAVALRALRVGEVASAEGGETVPTVADIPASHKIARVDIAAGSDIVKYGEVVAVSTVSIRRGDWVHTHNVEGKRWNR